MAGVYSPRDRSGRRVIIGGVDHFFGLPDADPHSRDFRLRYLYCRVVDLALYSGCDHGCDDGDARESRACTPSRTLGAG